MKKTVLLAAIVLLGTAGVSAQDTIHGLSLKANYFYNNWIDATVHAANEGQSGGFINGDLRAKWFYSKDELRVKGIAVIMGTETYVDTTDDPEEIWYNQYLENAVMNKTYENAYEYLSLYKPDSAGGLTLASDSLIVHIKDTAPAYYLDLGLDVPYYNRKVRIQPVHEVFFDSAVTIDGDFYIGVTKRSYQENVIDDTGRVWEYSYFPVDLFGYIGTGIVGDSVVDHHPTYGWHHGRSSLLLFLFPIMEGYDTTIVDTTGIASPQLLGRYVSVVPNPAADKAQVLSSFGLREVEVYDAAGTRVLLRRRLTGYAADLDVSALPAGAYLVRVTTLSGTVTKKLVVQRR